MDTKTCKGCGWVFAKVTPYKSCPFCGRYFTEGVCIDCGEYSYDLVPSKGICPECQRKRVAKYNRNRTPTDWAARRHKKICEEDDKMFDDWVAQIKELKMHTLTEEEWMEACRYFGGCAVCASESIDARGYFISYEDGGRYNAANVIPICEKCATAAKAQHNPFRRSDTRLASSPTQYRGANREKLSKVVDYLQRKIDEGRTNNE